MTNDGLQAIGNFIAGMVLDDAQALHRNALRFGPAGPIASQFVRHTPNPIMKDNPTWLPNNDDPNEIIGDALIALSYTAAPVFSLASAKAGVSAGKAALDASKASGRAQRARLAAKTFYVQGQKQKAAQAAAKATKHEASSVYNSARRTEMAARAYRNSKYAAVASAPNAVDDVDYTVNYIADQPTREEIIYGKKKRK